MLRWLLLLTMSMLPWFAWAGSDMAAAGAPHHGVVAHTHAAAAGVEDAAAQAGEADPDCIEHAGSGTHHDHHAGTASDPGDCPTCSACQACSSAALVGTVTVLPPGAFGAPHPLAPLSRFVSADRAPGFKPPIS
jgi:hypothetical protein